MTEAAQKFSSEHKAFKVYLKVDEDMAIIKMLMGEKSASKLIRDALKFYFEQTQTTDDTDQFVDLYTKYVRG